MSGSPFDSPQTPGFAPKSPYDDGVAEFSKEARNWAMAAHLSALIGLAGTIPLANILGPLVVWLIKKDEMPFVNDQGKEALNFQISVTIYLLASVALLVCVIGIVGVIGVPIFGLVFTIVAAISAAGGKAYRYPLTIRLIK